MVSDFDGYTPEELCEIWQEYFDKSPTGSDITVERIITHIEERTLKATQDENGQYWVSEEDKADFETNKAEHLLNWKLFPPTNKELRETLEKADEKANPWKRIQKEEERLKKLMNPLGAVSKVINEFEQLRKLADPDYCLPKAISSIPQAELYPNLSKIEQDARGIASLDLFSGISSVKKDALSASLIGLHPKTAINELDLPQRQIQKTKAEISLAERMGLASQPLSVFKQMEQAKAAHIKSLSDSYQDLASKLYPSSLLADQLQTGYLSVFERLSQFDLAVYDPRLIWEIKRGEQERKHWKRLKKAKTKAHLNLRVKQVVLLFYQGVNEEQEQKRRNLEKILVGAIKDGALEVAMFPEELPGQDKSYFSCLPLKYQVKARINFKLFSTFANKDGRLYLSENTYKYVSVWQNAINELNIQDNASQAQQQQKKNQPIKPETLKQYDMWQIAVDEMHQQNKRLSHNAICSRIASKFGVAPDSIRKVTKLKK